MRLGDEGDVFGGRSSERERLPPFYSGADLHNDQRLSCLSKLFSAICIIFCRAESGARGRKGGEWADGSEAATGWSVLTMREEREKGGGVDTLLLSILECILCARLMKL